MRISILFLSVIYYFSVLALADPEPSQDARRITPGRNLPPNNNQFSGNRHPKTRQLHPGYNRRITRQVNADNRIFRRTQQYPVAICFREPCRPPVNRRFRRSALPEPLPGSGSYFCNHPPCRESPPSRGQYTSLNRRNRPRRGVDDKGFAEYSKHANTRGMLHSQTSFGPNSDGAIYSTGKIEHDLWKSQDGNGRVTAFGRYDRVDGGRMNGFNDKKFGLKYSFGF